MSQPANEPDDERMADILSRLSDLEEELRQAWGKDVEQHPELLAKSLASLRGKVAAHADVLYGLRLEVGTLKASLAGWTGGFPN